MTYVFEHRTLGYGFETNMKTGKNVAYTLEYWQAVVQEEIKKSDEQLEELWNRLGEKAK